MDLRNNNITVREIMSVPAARTLLLRELSGYINPQMIAFASNMTLSAVLNFAKGRIKPEKVNDLIEKLKKI